MAKVENNKIVWETSEFPILCETCLGDNPYVRMTKQPYGKECKICSRPFTIFRWCPGTNMRYKKTEICQTCAKIKNVRDAGLGVTDNVPTSNVNKDYFVKNAEKQLENGQAVYDYEEANAAGKDLLKRLARTEPFYKRNRPHICSFYVKGTCTRGDACPYRHEVPVENDLAKQNIKDRYYGNNDPVAKKIMQRTSNSSSLVPPEDKSISSLFLTGIHDQIFENDIRNHFAGFGEIKSVVVVYKANCAFVNFLDRMGAEAAASQSFDVTIKGTPIQVSWGRPKTQGVSTEQPQASKDVQPFSYAAVPPPPGLSGSTQYPSQDPSMFGSSNNPK